MDLSTVLRILRRYWLPIVAATLIGVVVGYGWTLTQSRVYEAEASGFVTTGAGSNLALAAQGDAYATSRASSYVAIGKTRPVAESARDVLGTEAAPDALSARVTVTNPSGTALIRITATGPSAADAQALADAWITGMSEQVDVIENAGSGSNTAVTKLLAFEAAELPRAPVFPNVRLALALGGLVGVVIGLIYAFVRSVLDRRIRSAKQIEETFDLAVVGTIPVDKRLTDSVRLAAVPGAGDPSARDNGVGEAMRELRTNLEFMDIDSPPRVIVVTSPLPGDGKSTVTANLAVTIAASGQRVIVVDGDLRRPTVAKAFGLVGGIGLTDVLVGRAEIDDVMQPWGTDGNLFVLGAGSPAPNPSELLGSKIMQILLEELAREFIVLVDAPPLIPVTDAAILAAHADGALLVAGAGRSTFEAVEKSLANLARVGAHPLGVILNRMSRAGADGAYYGYQYANEYVAADAGEGVTPIPPERRGRLRHGHGAVAGTEPSAQAARTVDSLLDSLSREYAVPREHVLLHVQQLLEALDGERVGRPRSRRRLSE
ncbi:polysaccharide biosynthesis tyrosine autokinase [Microbacteriaceae bacterium VKM Ac-2854]|nr:polysaccharide biosynthesis tyrosine autokinase [Microbacteriaceae bacterium VKM Ac-2854]